MYRFLWRPSWVVSHVLILALIVAMVSLGLWQLRRLDERQDRNAQIEAHSVAAPLTMDEAVAAVDGDGAEAASFRPVRVAGTYDPAGEVAIRSRSFEGAPGRWVATPLVPSDGSPTVLVVRGWIPQAVDDTDPPIDGAEPPAGEVEVTGYLMPTQEQGTFGSTDAPTGTLSELSRVDVERFAQQYPGVEASFWLQLSDQIPPTESDLLNTVTLPEPGDGPHLSYAVQWGIFTLIAIVGYPMILRRVARQKRADAAAPPGPRDDDAADGDREPGSRPAEVGGG